MAVKHYVRPADRGWEVVVEGHRRGVARAETKKDAITRAKQLARRGGGGEIRILNVHGKVTGEASVRSRTATRTRTAR